jgi:hypothetical protein
MTYDARVESMNRMNPLTLADKRPMVPELTMRIVELAGAA